MRSDILGYTFWGRPILCLQGGDGPRRVLICAAHHGSEWITMLLLRRFWSEFCVRGDWRRAAHLWVVPCVNPDGCALSMGQVAPWSPQYLCARSIARREPDLPFPSGWKANGRGVDLNLNYPALWDQAVETKGLAGPAPRNWPGPCPFSEEETRLLAELTVLAEPDVMVTLHAQGEEIYWEFGGIPVAGAESLGRLMAERSGYRLTSVPPESAYAGYKDWFIQEFRRPGYTVECGLGENPLPVRETDQIYRAVRPILRTALLGC
ncbi:MAG: M14 family zinc carboxypeptidase [Oscillospiraceae bacterium]|nr:M14 family zinc carboxypeptidase [Oscillospiraceae bacterium]